MLTGNTFRGRILQATTSSVTSSYVLRSYVLLSDRYNEEKFCTNESNVRPLKAQSVLSTTAFEPDTTLKNSLVLLKAVPTKLQKMWVAIMMLPFQL